MAPWIKYSTVRHNDVDEKDIDDDDDSITDPCIENTRSKLNVKAMLRLLAGLTTVIVLLQVTTLVFEAVTTTRLRSTKWTGGSTTLPLPGRNGFYVTKIVNGEVIEGTQCGDTWQEAKALGCIYDKIASRWYAPECFDKESFEAMLLEPGTNYTWYSDKEHTVEVPTSVGRNGEWNGLLYPWPNFHKIHCLYLWRKMHHALLNNLPLDDDLMEEDHTIHCTKNLLTWADSNVQEVASIAHAGRPFCRRNRLGVLPMAFSE